MVFFEWDAPSGEHALTASWKDPSGKVVFISPDLRIQSQSRELRAYWNYEIYPTTTAGIWTIEIRIDGQPAGSHNFELVVPAQPAAPTGPSLDEVYRTSIRSMVWVHKLDQQGRRIDVSEGFVIGQDQIATAFQSIDFADGIEVEFADGRVVKADQLSGWNRLQDWAVVAAPTLTVPALPLAPSPSIAIGDHHLVFAVEGGLSRTIGGVDVSGRRQDPVFGERIQITPALGAETAGGPLLTPAGKVAALLGGSQLPGSRSDARSTPAGSPYWPLTSLPVGAIPIRLVTVNQPTSLAQLNAAHVLSEPIRPTSNFLDAVTAVTPKKGAALPDTHVAQFSRRDSITVLTTWRRKEKDGKGAIGAKVYDAQNSLVVDITPRKVNLDQGSQTRLQFDFTLGDGPPRSSYRIDIRWNDDTVWRTFVTLID
ncbi:MAG: S1C family serine protease [Bryobacteraceae bacterium]